MRIIIIGMVGRYKNMQAYTTFGMPNVAFVLVFNEIRTCMQLKKCFNLFIPLTYPHFNARKMKYFHGRRLLRCVPVELSASLIPFHRVQAIVLNVIGTFKNRLFAPPHGMGHSHSDIAQRTADL